jgi:hypothetical protein
MVGWLIYNAPRLPYRVHGDRPYQSRACIVRQHGFGQKGSQLNEWAFAAEIKSWWDPDFARHPEWRIDRCEVENASEGSRQRSDLVVLGGGVTPTPSKASGACSSGLSSALTISFPPSTYRRTLMRWRSDSTTARTRIFSMRRLRNWWSRKIFHIANWWPNDRVCGCSAPICKILFGQRWAMPWTCATW